MTIAALAVPPADKSLSGPLTSEHQRELTLARQRAKSIHKAARVAAFNGWATAVMALLSAPFALFGESALLVFIGLSAVAYNEFLGRKWLLRFDRRAATLLGWNQLALLSIIVGYSLWAIYTNLNEATSVAAELQSYSEFESAFGSPSQFETLATQIVIAFYGSVIGASVLFQGLNALYYFTRRKYIDAYIADTPEWIHELESGRFKA
jgi:hypothetical protein